ncbi:ORF36 [Retroperitoneal fibromatosis-associated herpesvirus]|uniref:ORF36 n=1 Tax=Retroperitoneal fibromatosis-associated herpesvirus TaxID=111469 RepID=U5NM56_9GAMA|nr:ORF36 [Retroperitoneal fibromatosis-associated herpesvirus]AGY30718.1 ORF36 [Retroperitoneal fibromatosis-associated herpesvirus]
MRWKSMELTVPETGRRRCKILSSTGALAVCPRCALELPKNTGGEPRPWASLWQLNQHVVISKTKKSIAYVRVPRQWFKCDHEDADWSTRLGRGAFGVISPVSEDVCMKHFDSRREFYYEAIVNDLMQATRERHPFHEGAGRLLGFVGVCVPCRALLFPRLKCNLLQLDWSKGDLGVLTTEFTGLLSGILFLNRYCAMTHCDVSPDNILATGDLTLGDPGRLILSDLGSVVLHTGSKWSGLVVTSNLGLKQHSYEAKVSPKLICKHLYKPSCVLLQCYLSCLGQVHATVLDQSYPLSPQFALTVDVSSLGYSLLACLELYLDLPAQNPLKFLFHAAPGMRPDPVYYLGFMIPRVVMSQILSNVWRMTIDLGLDCTGNAPSLPVRQPHREAFERQCYLYKANHKAEALATCAEKLSCSRLKTLVKRLLHRDYFSHGGRQHNGGFFF